LLFRLGNQGDTKGKSIAIDKDSNFIVAGTFQGTLNFNTKGQNELTSNLGSNDVFVAKYDKNGNYKWAKSVGTSGIDEVTAVKVDNLGNVYFTGYFGSENLPGRFIDLDPGTKEARFYGEGGLDCFIVKLNGSGDYQWGFVLTNKENFGAEIIWDFEINKSGQLYLSGIFSGTVNFNPKGTSKRIACPTEGHGYFTAKYEKTGDNQWVSVVGANIQNPLDEGFSSIDIDGNDGCVLSGNFRDTAIFIPDVDKEFPMVSSGSSDMFIARYSSTGKITFRGGFGGKEQDRIFPACGKIGTDGNLYITGNFLGKADFYPGFGTREIENKSNARQIFLASYTLSGTLRWAYTLDSDAEDDVALSMDFDGDGNVCLGGYFTGTTNFNPKGSKLISSNGTSDAADAFLAKYDNMGSLLWVNNFGDKISGKDKYDRSQFTSIFGIKVDTEDNALVTGKFYSTVDFDPLQEVSSLTVSKIFDLFLAKYDYDGYLWYDGNTRPKLKLISPNGGEVWNLDSTRIISWNSKNIEFIRIDYSIDDGENWIMISDSVSASSGTFSWLVENTPSERCRVKITSLYDNNLFDISNEKFEITAEVKPSRVIFSWGNPGPVSGKSIAVDSKNNFIVAGAFQGTINCDQGRGSVNLTAKGNQDLALVKYNEYGDLIWGFNIGATGIICEPNVIAIDGSDNIYVAGYFGKSGESNALLDFSNEAKVDTFTALGGYDAFIVKYTNEGKFVWSIPLGNDLGTSTETINDMFVENNGTIFVTGVFSGSVDFDPSKTVHKLNSKDGNPEIFIVKYNSEGKYSWAINVGTKMSNPDTEGLASIHADGSGGCYVLGNFKDSVNFHPLSMSGNWMKSKAENDIFLARYKINGYLDWAVQIEGLGNDITGSGCLKLGGGNLYISGIFDGKADFYPGLPKSEITSTDGTHDIFLASYTTSGNLNWAKKLASKNGFDFPKSLELESTGNILLSGFFSDDLNFGDEQNSLTYTSYGTNGAADIFLSKFDREGKVLWAKQFGADTSGSEFVSQPNGMAVDTSDNIFIIGEFFGANVDFDGSEATFFLSSQDRSDAFIAKYSGNGSLWVQAPDTTQLFLIKPNGGEKLFAGTNYNITWHSKYIGNIALKYSLDNGINWLTIDESVPASLGNYTWLVPDTTSDNCKIYIYNSENSRKMDVSSNPFIITDRFLDLLVPNGGEQWIAGTLNEINWKSNKVGYINIYFSTNNGINWNPLALYYNASLSSMTWTGIEKNSNQCLIKIVDVSDSSMSDISENSFTLRKSILNEIKIIAPNGGERWLLGIENNIMWSAKAIDSVKIEISTNSGLSWLPVIETYPAGNLIFNWMIKDSSYRSDYCLIRIIDLNDEAIFDISDSLFAIDIENNVRENNNFYLLGIYPQPAADEMIINFYAKIGTKYNYEILNSLSQIVYNSELYLSNNAENTLQINTSFLFSGVYILRINFYGADNLENNKSLLPIKFIILK